MKTPLESIIEELKEITAHLERQNEAAHPSIDDLERIARRQLSPIADGLKDYAYELRRAAVRS